MVRSVSPDGVPTRRDLELQTLLHLPRIADAEGRVEARKVVAEIDRMRRLRSDDLEFVRWMAAAPPSAPRLRELEVSVISSEEAVPVLKHFHYLRSPRQDAATVAALLGQR